LKTPRTPCRTRFYRLQTHRPVRGPLTTLYLAHTIVTNVSLMKLRRCSRHETLSLDQNHENDGAVFASELMDVRRTRRQSAPKQKWTKHFAGLSGSFLQSSAVQYRCVAGWFLDARAANALGISMNTLKSRVSRARTTSVCCSVKSRNSSVGKAAPVVERKSVVCLRRSSLEMVKLPLRWGSH